MTKDCTGCMYFRRFTDLKPHDLSEFGCVQSRWAGYVYDPNSPPCGGLEHTPSPVTQPGDPNG